MKASSLSLSIFLLLFAVSFKAQVETSTQNGAARSASEIKSGIFVESVEKNSAGEKAGLQSGDLLQIWSRGDAHGEIKSPFDLMEIEIEQSPRGAITVEGQRASEKRTWMLGQDSWQILSRPNLSSELLSLYTDGQDIAKTGKLADAAARWQSAADMAAQRKSSITSAWFSFHAAEVFSMARQWEEADTAYQSALRQASEATPMIGTQLLDSWAETFAQRNDATNAEKYYLQALEEIENSKPASLMAANILFNIGCLNLRRGDWAKAEQYLDKAVAIQQAQLPDSLTVASSLNSLGYASGHRGDLDKSENYLRHALAIYKKLEPESLDVAHSLYGLGMLAWTHGNLSAAESNLDQARSIVEKLAPGSPFFVDVLGGVGLVTYGRGDLANAEEYLLQALAISEKVAPGSRSVAMCLGNLGQVTFSRGYLSKSEEYLTQAMAIYARQDPESRDVAETFNNLGLIAEKRNELNKAEEYFRRALTIQEKHSPNTTLVAESLGYLGVNAADRGDWAKSEEYNLRALAIQEKLTPNSSYIAATLSDLADAARNRGNLSKAEEYYKEAILITRNIAPESTQHAETVGAFASLMVEKHQPDTAAKLYQEAIDALEGQTARFGGAEDVRSNYRANHADFYESYVALLLKQKRPEEAFQILERSRAQTLLETIAAAHVDIHKGTTPSLLEQERQLQEAYKLKSDARAQLLSDRHTDLQMSAADKELTGILNQYQEVEGIIRESSPAYAALTRPQSLSAKQVQQQLLDADSLLLEYSLGEPHSYVFAVTSSSLKTYELPGKKEIEASARHLYDLLTARNQIPDGETAGQRREHLVRSDVAYQSTATILSRMILAPFADQLHGRHLLIVSDGALQYIPFAVLPSPETPGNTVSLVAEHEIVNLPSASVLAELRREQTGRTAAPKTVAVLADPVFSRDDSRFFDIKSPQPQAVTRGAQDTPSRNNGEADSSEFLTRSLRDVRTQEHESFSLPRLVFSRQEADNILAVAPAGSAMRAVDFDANRAAVINANLAQYRIVHFATHGLLDSKHPELSGLVLSLIDKSGKPENGFLSLQDIYNLNLPVDMVVLSACETGLGKEINGEGIVGLTRGFMYAGASRVVASLWKVDDVATAELMSHFYAAIFQDKLAPAAALRKAQIEMSQTKRWASPYYWAGFEMQGESKAMQ